MKRYKPFRFEEASSRADRWTQKNSKYMNHYNSGMILDVKNKILSYGDGTGRFDWSKDLKDKDIAKDYLGFIKLKKVYTTGKQDEFFAVVGKGTGHKSIDDYITYSNRNNGIIVYIDGRMKGEDKDWMVIEGINIKDYNSYSSFFKKSKVKIYG
jgi:hypothetical protein